MLGNVLVPDTLFFYIKNEQGIKKFPALRNLREFYARRGKAISAALQKKSLEERRARCFAANEARRKQFRDPKTREEALKQPLKNLEKMNKVRVVEVPRINTYSGVITSSDMEKVCA